MKWLMTLLGVFRGVSRKVVKERSENIYFDDLASWLDKRTRELVEKESLQEYLSNYVNFLRDKRWLLEQQMEGGINVPEDLHSGCKEVLQLLTFKEDPDIKETLMRNSYLKDKLEKVLPKAKVEIVNPLLRLFFDIDNAGRKFIDKVNLSGYPRIANLHKRMSSLQKYKYRVDKWEEELRNKKRRLYLTEDKKKEKEKLLNSLQEESTGPLLLKFRKMREELIQEKEEIETKIFYFFLEIKPLLQKYKDIIGANGLLSSYIDNPIDAFLNDEGLVLKHSLQHLRAVLNSGKFSWSVEENVSSLKKLDLISENKLEQMQVKLLGLKRHLESVEESSVDKDMVVEIGDAEYRWQHFIEQINKLEDDISSLEEKIDTLKEEWSKELQLFQNLVNIGFGIDLNIEV